MSAPTPMDISDAGGDKSRNNSLAVNRSNNKIGKNARGRNLTPPRPEAKVIHIEVTDFLRTVQELTAQEPAPPAARTVNSRLSNLAPPPLPLRPSVSYPKMPQPPHLPTLMSPTQNGQRVQGFSGFPNMQQRLSPRAVSPMPPLLTPGTFAPLPPLSPSDRWADLESPSTAFFKHAAHAMVLTAAATSRVEAAPPAPPPQQPSRLDPGNGGFPSFYHQAAGSYSQYPPRLESGNGMNHPFSNRMDSGMGPPPSFPSRMDVGTMAPAGLQQFPLNMQSGFGGGFPQFPSRMESGGAATGAGGAGGAGGGFSQLLPRMEHAGGNAFPQFPSRMESGFGSFPPLSPRFDAQGPAQPFSPLSPTFGLPPLSPTMSLPPLSPTFPLSPLGYGNQDFGFGLNNVYAGFANSLSPTAGLTNDPFSFPDRVLS